MRWGKISHQEKMAITSELLVVEQKITHF